MPVVQHFARAMGTDGCQEVGGGLREPSDRMDHVGRWPARVPLEEVIRTAPLAQGDEHIELGEEGVGMQVCWEAIDAEVLCLNDMLWDRATCVAACILYGYSCYT